MSGTRRRPRASCRAAAPGRDVGAMRAHERRADALLRASTRARRPCPQPGERWTAIRGAAGDRCSCGGRSSVHGWELTMRWEMGLTDRSNSIMQLRMPDHQLTHSQSQPASGTRGALMPRPGGPQSTRSCDGPGAKGASSSTRPARHGRSRLPRNSTEALTNVRYFEARLSRGVSARTQAPRFRRVEAVSATESRVLARSPT